MRHFRLGLGLVFVLAVGCGGSDVRVAAAPRPEPPKPTCLILSVGGPAGVAHLGAIEALRERNVEITCVVGNSMGSLVGALYASAPDQDTTGRFRGFMARYVEATEQEAAGRAGGGALLGLIFFGPVGALAGGAAGAASVNELDHGRVVNVLDQYLGGASFDDLPLPFQTSYLTKGDTKVVFVEAAQGNVARAVGGSVANPYLFREIDVRDGGPIDPGVDRVASIPIEQGCSVFHDHNMLAVNVTSSPAFVSANMRCPSFEVDVDLTGIAQTGALTNASAFDALVVRGHDAMNAWLSTAEGKRFLATARRAKAKRTRERVPSTLATRLANRT